jgi:hypothetical protein
MKVMTLAAEAVREAEELDRVHRSLASILLLVAARQFQAQVALFVERLRLRSPS